MSAITAEELRLMTAYANDAHPRVSEEEMQRAIEDTEARYGCDFAHFTEAMENHAISLAVEHRVVHEENWFDGSEKAWS